MAYRAPEHDVNLPGGTRVRSSETRHHRAYVGPHRREEAAAYLRSILPPECRSDTGVTLARRVKS